MTEQEAETGDMAILGHSPFCIAAHPSDMDAVLTPGDLSITTAKLLRPE